MSVEDLILLLPPRVQAYIRELESYVRAREPNYSQPHSSADTSGFHYNRNGEKVLWRIDGVKVLLLDMDGVLANFEAPLKEVVQDPPEMFEKDFFLNLPVNEGAKEFVEWAMSQPKLEVYICSKPLTTKGVLWSATEKMQWVQAHFPSLLKRMMLVCDKGLVIGDVLADDDDKAWKGKFKGEFFHFDRYKTAESFEKLKKHLALD